MFLRLHLFEPSTVSYSLVLVSVLGSAGDLIDPDSISNSVTSSGSGQQITFSGINANNDTAVVRVSYTITITDPVNRDKTLRAGRMLKVTGSKTSSYMYGTAYDHKEITLGVPALIFKS